MRAEDGGRLDLSVGAEGHAHSWELRSKERWASVGGTKIEEGKRNVQKREGGKGEVQSIAEETEGEDCRGEGIAGQTGIAIEQLCKDFVMIFCMWKSLDIA